MIYPCQSYDGQCIVPCTYIMRLERKWVILSNCALNISVPCYNADKSFCLLFIASQVINVVSVY